VDERERIYEREEKWGCERGELTMCIATGLADSGEVAESGGAGQYSSCANVTGGSCNDLISQSSPGHANPIAFLVACLA
jgi:hypothetical protein